MQPTHAYNERTLFWPNTAEAMWDELEKICGDTTGRIDRHKTRLFSRAQYAIVYPYLARNVIYAPIGVASAVRTANNPEETAMLVLPIEIARVRVRCTLVYDVAPSYPPLQLDLNRLRLLYKDCDAPQLQWQTNDGVSLHGARGAPFRTTWDLSEQGVISVDMKDTENSAHCCMLNVFLTVEWLIQTLDAFLGPERPFRVGRFECVNMTGKCNLGFRPDTYALRALLSRQEMAEGQDAHHFFVASPNGPPDCLESIRYDRARLRQAPSYLQFTASREHQLKYPASAGSRVHIVYFQPKRVVEPMLTSQFYLANAAEYYDIEQAMYNARTWDHDEDTARSFAPDAKPAFNTPADTGTGHAATAAAAAASVTASTPRNQHVVVSITHGSSRCSTLYANNAADLASALQQTYHKAAAAVYARVILTELLSLARNRVLEVYDDAGATDTPLLAKDLRLYLDFALTPKWSACPVVSMTSSGGGVTGATINGCILSDAQCVHVQLMILRSVLRCIHDCECLHDPAQHNTAEEFAICEDAVIPSLPPYHEYAAIKPKPTHAFENAHGAAHQQRRVAHESLVATRRLHEQLANAGQLDFAVARSRQLVQQRTKKRTAEHRIQLTMANRDAATASASASSSSSSHDDMRRQFCVMRLLLLHLPHRPTWDGDGVRDMHFRDLLHSQSVWDFVSFGNIQ